jgi:Putative phage metallopeptidase
MAEKKINFEIIEDTDSEPYQILADMRRYHSDVDEAAIALAWRTSLKPDKDGHLILGKCVKVSDLYREFAQYDFIILLNREVWEDGEFTEEKKRALIDHELCHAAGAEDDDGPKYDERGRRVFRTRKHDIEEFRSIVERHGCYKRDLELFAEALTKKRSTPLLDLMSNATIDAHVRVVG